MRVRELELHPWSAAVAVGILFGLFVGGMDRATGDYPLGALLRGSAWAAGGVRLHRFSVAVVALTLSRPSRSDDPDNKNRRESANESE